MMWSREGVNHGTPYHWWLEAEGDTGSVTNWQYCVAFREGIGQPPTMAPAVGEDWVDLPRNWTAA